MTSNIKQEIKLEDGMSIKPEPDDDMDISEAEDDDSGELQFPKTTPQNSWLMRVPKDLWAGLSSLNMDDQIQVGELWEWKDEKTGKTTVRIIPQFCSGRITNEAINLDSVEAWI
jgi:hypothetical protein